MSALGKLSAGTAVIVTDSKSQLSPQAQSLKGARGWVTPTESNPTPGRLDDATTALL
jgi:hypothetical protein